MKLPRLFVVHGIAASSLLFFAVLSVQAQNQPCANPNAGKPGTPAERAARFQAAAEMAANAVPPDPCVVDFLSRAASLTGAPGRAPQGDEHSVSLLRTAVANGESAWGADSVKLVPFLSGLSDQLWRMPRDQTAQDQARVLEAEGIVQRALSITEKVYGPDDIHDAPLIGQLAMVTSSEDRPPTQWAARGAKAEALFERELSIKEKVWGANDFRLTDTLWRLAAEYSNERLYCSMPYSGRQLSAQEAIECMQKSADKAEPVLLRDVRILKATPGPNGGPNASLDLPLDMLAQNYRTARKNPEAIEIYRQKMELDGSLGPQPSAAVMYDYQNIATCYENMQNDASAREALGKALEIAMQIPAPKTPSQSAPPAATVLASMGRLDLREHDVAAAQEHFQQALEIAGKDSPPYSAGVIQVSYAEANAFMGMQPEEALKLFQGIIAAVENNPPPAAQADFMIEPDYMGALSSSPTLLVQLHRDSDAEAAFRKAIAAAQGDSRWKFQETNLLSNYSAMLKREGRLDDAQAELQRLLSITKDDANFQTQYARALRNEADLLRQMNKPEDAAKVDAQAKNVEAANAAAPGTAASAQTPEAGTF